MSREGAETTIARRLACLRAAAGLRLDEAAAAVGCQQAAIARLESGREMLSEHELAALLTRYGVHDWFAREHVLALARGARTPGWFDAADIPLPQAAALALEDHASLIYSYAPQFIPPLLQTRAYAEAAVRAARHPGATPDQIRRGADQVMRRQEVLDRTAMWVVLDQRALLEQPLAGVEARVAQFDALIAAAKERHITLQIARSSTVTHYLYQGAPFTLLRFPESHRPDVLALHLLHGPSLVGERQQVEDYHVAFARLYISAHPIDATADVLSDLRRAVCGT
ncbi:Scr1 family TA system antitoxin-like transcriptional regulator [Nonomuraea sp. NPDC050556]|uniref:Scr1 family TA system antitoxin-like transcriptional regulator n=1 Tax=Nonomuraea sp. NPDC050556 TaxID=3364369 RepID=UPI0037953538